MKCDNCGKQFEPDKFHKQQKNCNSKCYAAGYRKKHREKQKSYWKEYYLKNFKNEE